MDAIVARQDGYSLAGKVFCVGFQGVFPAFCGDRSERPYLTRFVAHGQQFCAVVAIDRTTTETTRSDADQRKTNQTPHPSARDGSGIPVPRVYKSTCVIGSMRVY
jgi:hypothetical protein